MGELQLGRGQVHSSFFYILIGAGLGGGLVMNGAYFRGENGRSGELGLMQLPGSDGGQVQSVVSLSGLSKHLQVAGVGLAEVFSDPIGPQADAALEAWIVISAGALRQAILAIYLLINPAAILIGGGLPSIHIDRLVRRLNADLTTLAVVPPVIAPVERAALSVDAPAVGAAILPLSHFLLPRSGALWKVA
jgi:predicted NBD/HSP70 family sugar kinase